MANKKDFIKSTTFAPLTRRRFIQAGTGTAMALMLPSLIACRDTPDNSESVSDPNMPVDLPQPSVLRANGDGVLSLTYDLAFADYIIRRNNDDGARIESMKLQNRTYGLKRSDGIEPMIPGPTWRVNGGDQIKFELINHLPKNDPNNNIGCGDNGEMLPNCFHALETTNFHTHGLHISPTKPSDDVLISIIPDDDPACDEDDENCFQGKYDYTFDIWENHPPGTHWYHPHKHGSTNQQVQNGLAGLLIINDYPGTVPDELAVAEDLVFVLQELQKDPGPPINAGPMSLSATDEAFYFTVNGVEKPIIRLKQGELQRWRFVNAGVSDNGYVNLALVSEKPEGGDDIDCDAASGSGCQIMTLIAMDGIYLEQVQEVKNLLLAPGNRADFLVKLNRPGTYWLRDLGHNRGGDFSAAFAEGVEAPLRGRTRAIVVVEESDMDMPLPDKLPNPSPQDPSFLQPPTANEVTGYRQVIFDFLEFGDGDTRVTLNCKQFDAKRVDQLISPQAVEEWLLINRTPSDHPFHIHVNPFWVFEQNGREVQNPRWLDVVNIPGTENARRAYVEEAVRRGQDEAAAQQAAEENVKYGSIKFRARYLHFTGKFVLHCHILAHEDFGMMQLVEVRDGVDLVDSGSYDPCSPLARPEPLPEELWCTKPVTCFSPG